MLVGTNRKHLDTMKRPGGVIVRYSTRLVAITISLCIGMPVLAAPFTMLQRSDSVASSSASERSVETESRYSWLKPWSKKKAVESPGTNVNPIVTTTIPPQAVYQAPIQPAPATPVVVPSATIAAVPSAPAAQTTTSGPTCHDLRNQGHEADRQGNLGEAERFYRLAMAADPTSAAAVNDLALCLARQGQLDSSAQMFMKAISMRPEKPLYRNNIATVLVEMNLIEDAKSHLLTVYSPSTASYNLGHLLHNRGKDAEALLQFQAAITEDPTFAPAQEMIVALSPTRLPEYLPSVPQVAQASVQPVPAPQVPALAPAQTIAVPTQDNSTTATPNFPRLLPPVINR